MKRNEWQGKGHVGSVKAIKGGFAFTVATFGGMGPDGKARTDWHDCVRFEKEGGRKLKEPEVGDFVEVVGNLRYRPGKDGKGKYCSIIVQSVDVLRPKSDAKDAPADAPEPAETDGSGEGDPAFVF